MKTTDYLKDIKIHLEIIEQFHKENNFKIQIIERTNKNLHDGTIGDYLKIQLWENDRFVEIDLETDDMFSYDFIMNKKKLIKKEENYYILDLNQYINNKKQIQTTQYYTETNEILISYLNHLKDYLSKKEISKKFIISDLEGIIITFNEYLNNKRKRDLKDLKLSTIENKTNPNDYQLTTTEEGIINLYFQNKKYLINVKYEQIPKNTLMPLVKIYKKPDYKKIKEEHIEKTYKADEIEKIKEDIEDVNYRNKIFIKNIINVESKQKKTTTKVLNSSEL